MSEEQEVLEAAARWYDAKIAIPAALYDEKFNGNPFPEHLTKDLADAEWNLQCVVADWLDA